MAEVQITKAELDFLENELEQQETDQDIFRRVSYWLTKKFNCAFVLFFANRGTTASDHVLYYGEQIHSYFMLGTVVDERLDAEKTDPSLLGRSYIHPTGTLSRSIRYTQGSEGYLFLGPNGTGLKYTEVQELLMRPVCRIIHNALVNLECKNAVKERNRLRYAFGQYVSPEVVDNLMSVSGSLEPGGKKQTVSVIYSHIDKFTSLTESMESERLFRFLNVYFNEMTQVILSLGGTIDKYENGSIRAFFGAPNPLPDHAVRCCLAGLRMKKMEDVLNSQMVHEGLVDAPVHTSIGISSGEAVIGNLGSIKHLEYTVVGSNVSLASRLQSENKMLGTSILASRATADLARDFFNFKETEPKQLRHINSSVEAFELVDVNPASVPDYGNYVQEYLSKGESADLICE